MKNTKTILHCDMNSFFASVELLDYPQLTNCPVAVAGDPNSRHGIILAKNQLAKERGVVTAETVWQARKKCPGLVLLPPHHEKYHFYSEKINRIYLRFTDMVEPFSIDESWLDVTGSRKLFGTGQEIADRIRHTVKSELGLTLSAGVSDNRIFAKMGSDYKKPDATTVVTHKFFHDVFWPMDVDHMFFAGRKTGEKLKASGIETIGDLATSDPLMLKALIGKHGELLWKYANGLDNEPVKLWLHRDPVKSVGNGMTFKRNLVTHNDILTGVTGLSFYVAERLRHYNLKASGIRVDIKKPDFTSSSRQKQLISATDSGDDIKNAALELIKQHHDGSPIRMLTITAINLTEHSIEQISLFDNPERKEKTAAADRAVDEIRKRFGKSAIKNAQLLNNDLGIDI